MLSKCKGKSLEGALRDWVEDHTKTVRSRDGVNTPKCEDCQVKPGTSKVILIQTLCGPPHTLDPCGLSF